MTKISQPPIPVFDSTIPVPRKGPQVFLDPRHSFVVGQLGVGVSHALSMMQVGESCLLSNWSTGSINYVQKTTGYKFQRQIQENGTVRVWRVK